MVDPIDRLNGDEFQVAAARKVFIQEAVERLTTADLAAKTVAIAARDDRVLVALYARYAGPLVAELTQGRNFESVQQMREALAALDHVLTDDKIRAKRQSLESRKAVAEQLRQAARNAHLEADPRARRTADTLGHLASVIGTARRGS